MSDALHQWGNDLAIGPTGDVALASGPTLVQQRILRRLLTNLLDYIWQLDYGAGLAGFVGQPAGVSQIQAVVRSQIFKEASVATSPEPTIDVVPSPGGITSATYVYITYVDASSTTPQVLAFSLDT